MFHVVVACFKQEKLGTYSFFLALLYLGVISCYIYGMHLGRFDHTGI